MNDRDLLRRALVAADDAERRGRLVGITVDEARRLVALAEQATRLGGGDSHHLAVASEARERMHKAEEQAEALRDALQAFREKCHCTNAHDAADAAFEAQDERSEDAPREESEAEGRQG
jgi:hypothetical protein